MCISNFGACQKIPTIRYKAYFLIGILRIYYWTLLTLKVLKPCFVNTLTR